MLLGIIVGVIVFIVIIIPIIVVVVVVIIIVVCVTCGVWGGIAASRKSNRRHGGEVVTVAPVVQTVPASAGQPAAVVYQMQPTKTVVPVASSMEHGPSPSGQQGQVHVEVDTPATYPQDPKLTEKSPPAYSETNVSGQQ